MKYIPSLLDLDTDIILLAVGLVFVFALFESEPLMTTPGAQAMSIMPSHRIPSWSTQESRPPLEAQYISGHQRLDFLRF